jgi:hypothetical protein
VSRQKSSRLRDPRGSNADRRARKLWLLTAYGDGELTTCYRCSVPLDYETVTADRIDPGAFGGRYVRCNLRPACQPCQTETGNELLGKLRVGLRLGLRATSVSLVRPTPATDTQSEE